MVDEPVMVVKVLPPETMVAARGEVLTGVPYKVVDPVVVVMKLPSVVRMPTRGRTEPVGLPAAAEVMLAPAEVRTPTAPALVEVKLARLDEALRRADEALAMAEEETLVVVYSD